MWNAKSLRRFCLDGRACRLLCILLTIFTLSSLTGFIFACISLLKLRSAKADNTKDEVDRIAAMIVMVGFVINSLVSWIISFFLAMFVRVPPKEVTARYVSRVMTGIIVCLLPGWFMARPEPEILGAFVGSKVEKSTVIVPCINLFLAFLIFLSALVLDIPAGVTVPRTELEGSEATLPIRNASPNSLQVTEAGMAA